MRIRCARGRSARQATADDIRTLGDLPARLDLAVRSRPLFSAFKRLFDAATALAALVALSPLLLLVAAAIRLTSPGPILFSQYRLGRDGRPFRIFKFRTFYHDQSDATGVAHTVANDPRVTPLGRVLRRANIDELPQLWNVVIGDMSLVGPRPHAIGMKAVGIPFDELIPAYELRLLVRPGITGLAQSRGFRGEITSAYQARARVVLDLVYVSRFGPLQDIRVLINTVLRELRSGSGI